MTGADEADWRRLHPAVVLEDEALARVRRIAVELMAAAEPIWHWGDGYGGSVKGMLAAAATERGLPWEPLPDPRQRSKRKIGSRLRTSVYERDEYACVTCGSRKLLTLDHILPESLGGPSTLENLQTMCRSCNSRKGVRI